MTEVIVAYDKHGTFTYSSAAILLKERFDQGYWYDNWDDGVERHQWHDRAAKIVDHINKAEPEHAEKVERVSWKFLQERSDHEYEGVEKQTVR